MHWAFMRSLKEAAGHIKDSVSFHGSCSEVSVNDEERETY